MSKSDSDLARIITKFFADKNRRVGHNDALELIARLKGHRDLHEMQEREKPPAMAVAPLPQQAGISARTLALFFSTVALLNRNGYPSDYSIEEAKETLPKEIHVSVENALKELRREGQLVKAFEVFGLPRYLLAILKTAAHTGNIAEGFNTIADYLRATADESPEIPLTPIAYPERALASV